MIISYSRKFVVLAPWKTASSTLHQRLAHLNESRYRRFYDFYPALNRVTHQHLTCAEFAALPEGRAGFLVGAFVRNPYDRVYSGFLQLQRDIQSQPQATFPAPWIRDLVLKQLAENKAQLVRAEFNFDRWLQLVTEDQIFNIGRNSSLPLHPMHYWTHLAGRQYVSFIGRAERFEDDFERLCADLRIDVPPPVNANVSNLASADEVTGAGYRHASRMTRASIDRINTLFRSDFDIFGYEPL